MESSSLFIVIKEVDSGACMHTAAGGTKYLVISLPLNQTEQQFYTYHSSTIAHCEAQITEKMHPFHLPSSSHRQHRGIRTNLFLPHTQVEYSVTFGIFLSFLVRYAEQARKIISQMYEYGKLFYYCCCNSYLYFKIRRLVGTSSNTTATKTQRQTAFCHRGTNIPWSIWLTHGSLSCCSGQPVHTLLSVSCWLIQLKKRAHTRKPEERSCAWWLDLPWLCHHDEVR